MSTKVAINGFGRIGRMAFKRIIDKHPNLEIIAVNDLTDAKTLAHLLKYDSSYGRYEKEIKGVSETTKITETISSSGKLVIDDKKILIIAEKNPTKLPWKDLGVEIVIESTGLFTEYENAKKHLEAGAKKVIVSAPTKSKEINTYVLGVNEDEYDPTSENIISMASCTTNCLAPVVKVLHEEFGVERGFVTTAHSYTNDQRLLDLPHKDLRRARAAAVNIVPTTTGAAIAVTEVIPELKGKLDGIALRVPTPVVSICDLICVLKKSTSKEEINNALKEAIKGKLKGILAVSDEPLVSMDYKGDTHSSIVDSALTMANENLAKVVAWYDNEWGYSCRLAEMIEFVAKSL